MAPGLILTRFMRILRFATRAGPAKASATRFLPTFRGQKTKHSCARAHGIVKLVRNRLSTKLIGTRCRLCGALLAQDECADPDLKEDESDNAIL